MNLLKICNKIIEYSFYGIFLLVPWILWKDTSELFELNKMWFTWGLTIVIAMAWFTKMILQKKIIFQRTPLDIPIGLFLLSQIISTIFSLDVHVSFWGYYSRFNGGLLSTATYILSYYAFLSNFDPQKLSAIVHRLLAISLVSGLIAALWGLPSHFGYDPTCFVFRGTFDVSCWTADFQPRARIFSTLGQPDWLAAYLAILIPISIAFFINNLKSNSSTNNKYNVSGIMYYVLRKSFILNTLYLILTTLFYAGLLYTRARSGVLGIWLALIFFTLSYFFIKKPKLSLSVHNFKSPISILFFGFLIITFIIGTPIAQLRGFTWEGIKGNFQKAATPANTASNAADAEAQKKTETLKNKNPAASGGTESADIRLLVWEGGLNAWKNNPIFGTGVETFAFAYYKYKPVGQNLTSEWNFLYNKAHNEYLNYLATTGAFGLGTYLGMIGWFLFISLKQLKIQSSKFKIATQNSKLENANYTLDAKRYTLILALLASYTSILITNFFGFSVVMTNVYLFIIPAFVFVLMGKVETKTTQVQTNKAARIESGTSIWQWTPIFFIVIIGFFMLYSLVRFWFADISYALGYNLDRAGEYQKAYPNLHSAVELRGDEPVFKDELSVNDAIVAAALIAQKNQANQEQTISTASSLAQEAINTSNEIISQYTNNVLFWKTRVRLFYTLSQVDSRYLPRALDGIEKASLIAPNDANVWYNLGVLYGQNNNIPKGIEALEKTIKLKPDYRDARYALGLFYHTASLDAKGKVVVDHALENKALIQIQYILDHLNPQDYDAQNSLKNWEK